MATMDQPQTADNPPTYQQQSHYLQPQPQPGEQQYQPAYGYQPVPPPGEAGAPPPGGPAPPKKYCDFSRKCCFITWGACGGVTLLVIVIFVIVYFVLLAAAWKAREYERPFPSEANYNATEVLTCYFKADDSNSTTLCQPGQICKTEIFYESKDDSDSEAPKGTFKKGCTPKTKIECSFHGKCSNDPPEKIPAVKCYCLTNLCNSEDKCECSSSGVTQVNFWSLSIFLCLSFILRRLFN